MPRLDDPLHRYEDGVLLGDLEEEQDGDGDGETPFVPTGDSFPSGRGGRFLWDKNVTFIFGPDAGEFRIFQEDVEHAIHSRFGTR